MKILFIVPYPTAGASNRYRVEQFLPYLKGEGVQYSLRPFVSPEFFKILYQPGRGLRKLFYFLSATAARFRDLIAIGGYDLVFVHIESFPFGPEVFEWCFARLGKPVIYDFEDAVYLKDFKPGGRLINFLRHPQKFYGILRLSRHIIVCNRFMKQFVGYYNPRVSVIPTSIDTARFELKKNWQEKSRLPVVGWIGSHSTFPYLQGILPALEKLAERHKFILQIIGAGKQVNIPGIEVVNAPWSLQTEVEDFQSLDIGLYPLPDNEHSLAKTPFKTIQYMSVGVAPVVSRIGGNREIIQDGVNGFLVSTQSEWIEKISLLLENTVLRRAIGLAGRKVVEERYSLKVNAPKFLKVIRDVYTGRYGE